MMAAHQASRISLDPISKILYGVSALIWGFILLAIASAADRHVVGPVKYVGTTVCPVSSVTTVVTRNNDGTKEEKVTQVVLACGAKTVNKWRGCASEDPRNVCLSDAIMNKVKLDDTLECQQFVRQSYSGLQKDVPFDPTACKLK